MSIKRIVKEYPGGFFTSIYKTEHSYRPVGNYDHVDGGYKLFGTHKVLKTEKEAVLKCLKREAQRLHKELQEVNSLYEEVDSTKDFS